MNTPVTHDQMIKMFASYQDTNMEIIHSMQTAVNATTKAETDRIDVKLDGVIKRQDIANDGIAKNRKRIVSMSRTIGVVSWLGGHIKLCFLALFTFCSGVFFLYDKLDIIEIITLIFKKV